MLCRHFRTCCACTCKDYACKHSQPKWHCHFGSRAFVTQVRKSEPAHPHQGWRHRRISLRYHQRRFQMHSKMESLNLAHHWSSCWWGSQSPISSSTDWGLRTMSQWRTVARQQGPRELGFEANHNGFTAASSGFAAMKPTPGPGPSRPLSLSEVLCERPQLEKEFAAKWGIPKPQYRDQGSDALLRRQYKFCSKGEIGFIHSKYIISALPEEGERPIKTRKKITVDVEKEEEEERADQPLGVNWNDCTWYSETPCWCAWLPFPSFLNSTWRRKTLTLSMIGSMDLSWRAVGLPLRSRRCSWQSVMHGERFMSWCMVACISKKLLTRSKTTACSGWEKSMKESSPKGPKVNQRKARTRRAHGGTPSANLNGRRRGKGPGDKGGKGKGKGKSKPSDWPSNWAFKNPKGVLSFAGITSSRRPAKASADVPTIVQWWTRKAGSVMQGPKSTSQRIALTRLERSGRLPMALWSILEAQREATSPRVTVVQKAHGQHPPRLVVEIH